MDSAERKQLQTKLDLADPETGEDLKGFLKNAANQKIADADQRILAVNQATTKIDIQNIEKIQLKLTR